MFGLPIRNRAMAHDYKLAQALDDGTNYTDWCKQLVVWIELLGKAFSKDKTKATDDAYAEKFERFKSSNGISLANYTIEFEELFYCLEKYEI